MLGEHTDAIVGRRDAHQLLRAEGPLVIIDRALDFSRVSFVDLAGVALCRRLKQGRATLKNCSPFVKEQIDG
jgi:hypothetical protein